MSAPSAGVDVAIKGGLSVTTIKTPCPTCGLLADGIRCPRCNTVKLVSCAGSCRTCKTKRG